MNGIHTSESSPGHGFGTAPVFLAALSTILGAILFLRFGYAVGHVGILGALLIVLLGHLITIPTGLAVAEIATNRRVEGGGEYYIISRSFGATVGGAIGISLYFSQAISVAFYMIAFSEAFRPLFGWFAELTGLTPDIRMVGLPATALLLLAIMVRGANLGVNILWGVFGILALSLTLFFLGSPTAPPSEFNLLARIENPDEFFLVFAVVFPAFTGMTAGVGLSGDLKNPGRSIPLGTLAATLTGMAVYVAVIFKLGLSAAPADLASDQFIMSRIALWGPIIPIGLAAATLSSALGSILVAPRTLQALSRDWIFPLERVNRFLSRGRGKENEPVNATLVTSAIALFFISIGNVDFVARIISMFFMVTYGTLCLISFLEHFAGNTSYRPTFHSRWYLSLLGAAAAFYVMYRMQPLYAALALLTMFSIYRWLKRTRKGERNLAEVFKGFLFQLTRQLHILIQKKKAEITVSNWRPSFIAISSHSLTRLAPFDFLRWISHYYGFGSFIHFIRGPLNPETNREAKALLGRLIEQTRASEASIYVDTIVAPSFKTAVAQIVQIPGIYGLENNSILFEFLEEEHDDIPDILDGAGFAETAGFNTCILRSSHRHFGYRKKIHLWLTPGDYRNVNLMILLAYIIVGHPEWKEGEIELFAAFHLADMETAVKRLNELIDRGRIPISDKNVRRVPVREGLEFDELVTQHSEDADLVITGFSLKKAKQDGGEFFQSFRRIKDILFVRASQNILITEPGED